MGKPKKKILQLSRLQAVNSRGWPVSFSQSIHAILQNAQDFQEIKQFFDRFTTTEIGKSINSTSELPFPIFFCVERNCERSLRLLIEHGAMVNVTASEVPLLAFAIFYGRKKLLNTNKVVQTLLAFGAEPESIPRDMWEDIIKRPLIKDTSVKLEPHVYSRKTKGTWCTPEYRAVIAANLNLTQRYFLEKASRQNAPTGRQMQVAKHHNMLSLFQVPYYLIGQERASRQVSGQIVTHTIWPNQPPLSLVFAGPSGHGKTELARILGELLSVPYCIADCTEMRSETDLFGPKAPYSGHEKGSPVNNHLTSEDGKRSIVFLDEFEKTTEQIRNALLVVLDEGKYRDRRDPAKVIDCSKTIWVFASNLVDSLIVQFFKDFVADKPRSEHARAPFGKLNQQMRRRFSKEFGVRLFRAPALHNID